MLLFALAVPATAQDRDTTSLAPPDSTRHFGRAALEIVGLNVLVWSLDRFGRPEAEQEHLEDGWYRNHADVTNGHDEGRLFVTFQPGF